jgi:dTDP-4-amino-4,6-dideoxygalactose transaminase
VDSQVYFWPLSSLAMFKSVEENINSWSIPNRSINLSSNHDINNDELRRVVEIINNL